MTSRPARGALADAMRWAGEKAELEPGATITVYLDRGPDVHGREWIYFVRSDAEGLPPEYPEHPDRFTVESIVRRVEG